MIAQQGGAVRQRLSFAVVVFIVGVLSGAVVSEAVVTSPTNGRIAFSTHFVLPFWDRGVGAQVFSVGAGGGGLVQLTHVSATQDAAAPTWSPSGAQIVYESDVTGDMQIWLMKADGSNQHRLFHDPGWDDFTPHWSPDGKWIVFSRCASMLGYCTISEITGSGAGLHVLTGGHWADADPRFSPDGRWIAFDSTRGGFLSAVWVMNTDGSRLRRLTAPSLEAFWPSWSPNGSHIVFTRDCCLPYSQVFIMRSDGSQVRQVTHVGTPHQAGFASYSPDGMKLVLASDAAYPDQCCNDIYTINTNGTGLTRVTTTQPNAVLSDWGTHP